MQPLSSVALQERIEADAAGPAVDPGSVRRWTSCGRESAGDQAGFVVRNGSC